VRFTAFFFFFAQVAGISRAFVNGAVKWLSPHLTHRGAAAQQLAAWLKALAAVALTNATALSKFFYFRSE
jgi:uncharacterized iron-regulated membrane protein